MDMKIGVISDLHCGDPRRGLTAPGVIRRFARGLKKKRLDAIVLAGDVGEPLFRFTEALDIFIDLGLPVAVLPGNHDVWSTREHSSQDLLEHLLPAETAKRGFTWLETKNLYLRDSGVAIAGSMAWYDYSAAKAGVLREKSDQAFYDTKRAFVKDGYLVNWAWTDLEVCRLLREALIKRLDEAQNQSDITGILLCTHVPIFPQQRIVEHLWDRDPQGDAYYHCWSLGEAVERCTKKLRWVVSGHTHLPKKDWHGCPDGHMI